VRYVPYPLPEIDAVRWDGTDEAIEEMRQLLEHHYPDVSFLKYPGRLFVFAAPEDRTPVVRVDGGAYLTLTHGRVGTLSARALWEGYRPLAEPCEAQEGEGYPCILPEGHRGKHRAYAWAPTNPAR